MIQSSSFAFARTKILGTLGPASDTIETLIDLINAGMDGVRMNFSHGNYDYYEQLFKTVREASTKDETALAILVDLQGPKIRVGELSEPEFLINTGEQIEITIDDIKGTKELISTSYKLIAQDASVGNIILIDDGLLKLRVIEVKENSVICKIENGGVLRPKKGMNFPDMKLTTTAITEKDLHDVDFAIKHGADFIALSFVRQASDIQTLRDYLSLKGAKIPIIAKIEKKEAVENFEEILKTSDGIMVARGDLGVEMEAHQVPLVQKMIIRRCNEVGKLVITATQMLESMIHNPVPTRAEASDVANAVWDGTDVVMLSAETSVGSYPLKTVETMNNIIKTSGTNFALGRKINFETSNNQEIKLFEAVNNSMVQLSASIDAAAIVVFTHNGRTPKAISKFRPKAKIIALSSNLKTMNNLCLKWGVTTLYMEFDHNSFPIVEAKELIKSSGLVSAGDLVLFTSGAPISDKSRLNVLRVETI